MRSSAIGALAFSLSLLSGCLSQPIDHNTVVMVIESSPNNLDLRQGTDAQSERVGGIIFDGLVTKDEHYNLKPWLAIAWEQPDPLTLVIHLRDDVLFHDGRTMEAEDVAWSIRSMVDGTLITAKGGAFSTIDRIDVRDKLTLVLHLKTPDAGLLFNMSNGLFGVVPRGAGRDFGLHPVGTGPFAFVSAVQDKEVIVRRNERYWAGPPKIDGVRFTVVPDAITSALELRKGTADLASNVVTLDMIHTLEQTPDLAVASGASSLVLYTNFNVTDKVLRDRRVRQAIACAMDRQAIIDAIWRGQAVLANTLLPTSHWAAASNPEMAQYPHDIARAEQLLDDAGFHRGRDGIRVTITMKTSTDETTRLMAAVLQQQLRQAGIQLNIRSAEFGTFYSDVTRGAFQMYALRWIGSNEDPDIFRYTYGTASFPPKGANRGRYSNPRVDALLLSAAKETDQARRRADYVEVQKILSEDLPGIPLWYPNNEVVHSRRVEGVHPEASGTFSYLRTIALKQTDSTQHAQLR
jgi:peptide/nickel transport system substrate-binding protein